MEYDVTISLCQYSKSFMQWSLFTICVRFYSDSSKKGWVPGIGLRGGDNHSFLLLPSSSGCDDTVVASFPVDGLYEASIFGDHAGIFFRLYKVYAVLVVKCYKGLATSLFASGVKLGTNSK